MKKATILELDPIKRIENSINRAMLFYTSKLSGGILEIGLEASFQMHLGDLLNSELQNQTTSSKERFVVHFEKNIEIEGRKDYIDIVVEYRSNEKHFLYLIELKYKKETDSAPDLGNIYSYIDIYNLSKQKANNSDVSGCCFIFLTDYKTYTNKAKSGTRLELPMHDGANILKGNVYKVTGESAKNNTNKYPDGFVFDSNYKIEYLNFKIKEKQYWYYILNI